MRKVIPFGIFLIIAMTGVVPGVVSAAPTYYGSDPGDGDVQDAHRQLVNAAGENCAHKTYGGTLEVVRRSDKYNEAREDWLDQRTGATTQAWPYIARPSSRVCPEFG